MLLDDEHHEVVLKSLEMEYFQNVRLEFEAKAVLDWNKTFIHAKSVGEIVGDLNVIEDTAKRDFAASFKNGTVTKPFEDGMKKYFEELE